jgi:hypothetical protein
MPSLIIRHVTTYRYRQPVAFGEHAVRLKPRVNASFNAALYRLRYG